jgi:hypothetical protein
MQFVDNCNYVITHLITSLAMCGLVMYDVPHNSVMC